MRRLRQAGFLVPAALTGYLWLKGHYAMLPGWTCPVLAITGVPCPGCYLTRATAAALNGDISTSLSLHAFGPAVAAGLVVWSALALKRRRIMPISWRITPVLVTASALLLYWLLRLILSYGYGFEGMLGFPASS